MIGLLFLIAFGVYLLVSIWVTNKAVKWAKSTNRKPWLWGGLATFMMYNLVFWDLIPTLFAHKYYCSTQAGFWIYQTPEQFKIEKPSNNPENEELVRLPESSNLNNGWYRYWKNKSLYEEIKQEKIFTNNLIRTEKKLFFSKNHVLISHYLSFYRNNGWDGTPWGLRKALVLSLGARSCENEGNPPIDRFDKYTQVLLTK